MPTPVLHESTPGFDLSLTRKPSPLPISISEPLFQNRAPVTFTLPTSFSVCPFLLPWPLQPQNSIILQESDRISHLCKDLLLPPDMLASPLCLPYILHSLILLSI